MVEVALGSVWEIDVELIKERVTARTKAIVANSLHNPTESVYSESYLRQLAEFAIERDIYIITDESYDFLVNGYYFNISHLDSLRGRVVRCGSYSKRFGMTGWRIGYLYAEGDVMARIMRVHDNISVCAPHLAQEAVWYGLSHEIKEMRENFVQMSHQREIAVSALRELGDMVIFNEPQGVFYIMLGYRHGVSITEIAQRLLREARVFALPGALFGTLGEGYLRISYGGGGRGSCPILLTFLACIMIV